MRSTDFRPIHVSLSFVREEASLIDQSLINEIAVAFPLDPIPLADDITRCTYDRKNGGSFSGPCSDCVKIGDSLLQNNGMNQRLLNTEDSAMQHL